MTLACGRELAKGSEAFGTAMREAVIRGRNH
jgi:hypothetical protein